MMKLARGFLLQQFLPLVALLVLSSFGVYAADKPPHIFFILVDDLGWGDVGFNLRTENPEVQTPVMDELVANGIHLTRHYVHPTCSQTRTSLQSGRLPCHVNLDNPTPDRPEAGMHKNMTGFAEYLSNDFNYKTHYIGKWDVGMTTSKHIPTGRGYHTSLGYFNHANDYWTQECIRNPCCKEKFNPNTDPHEIYDFWDTDGPSKDLPNTDYEEFIFKRRMKKIIRTHDASSDPLMIFYAPHVAHCPLQVPEDYLKKFDFITETDVQSCTEKDNIIKPGQPQPKRSCRKQYRAMVNLLDEVIGHVVDTFKEHGLYDDLLIVLTSDNGGPNNEGATNFPLRGGKYTPWEGGIRSAAFVSGGYLPESVRGTTQNELMHITDWYATLIGFAQGNDNSVDEFLQDQLAADSGLPPVDAINMKPLLLGKTPKSPRREIPIYKGVLIVGDYKLIWKDSVKPHAQTGVATNGWTGPDHPNKVYTIYEEDDPDCSNGCLFNVVSDPSERINLASSDPNLLQKMKDRITVLSEGFYNNNFHGVDSCPENIDMDCACWMAVNYYGGYLGPYQDFDIAESAE